jgi:hypothetical protein
MKTLIAEAPVTGKSNPGNVCSKILMKASQEAREADLRRLRAVLGEVVLLPLSKDKGCHVPHWPKITVKSSARLKDRLLKSLMVGVLLGRASGDLITIDCDNDEFMESLVSANPWLRGTFFSKGKRAGNFWLRMEGDYPDREVNLQVGGEQVGEWRANGCQTAVIGEHPSGCPYRNNANEPMVVPFSRIIWPDMLESPPSIKFSSVDRRHAYPKGGIKGRVSSTLYTLHNTPKVDGGGSESTANSKGISLPGDKTTKPAAHDHLTDRKVTADPGDSVTRLYEIFVAGHLRPPGPSQRNKRLTKLMPFLHKNTSQELGMKIAAHDYHVHSSIFNDPQEAHMKEASCLWEGAESAYARQLCLRGREIYNSCNGWEKDGFRACRSLALFTEIQSCKKPIFFLSADHLGERIGCYSMQGWRFLRWLEKENAIKTEKRGVRREKGVKGRATYYRWLLQ